MPGRRKQSQQENQSSSGLSTIGVVSRLIMGGNYCIRTKDTARGFGRVERFVLVQVSIPLTVMRGDNKGMLYLALIVRQNVVRTSIAGVFSKTC